MLVKWEAKKGYDCDGYTYWDKSREYKRWGDAINKMIKLIEAGYQEVRLEIDERLYFDNFSIIGDMFYLRKIDDWWWLYDSDKSYFKEKIRPV